MQIKIGCDPEVFIINSKTKDYVSAHGYFPGDKKNPFPVESGAVQVDGTALEFNINPAETEEEFFKNIRNVYAQMGEMVTKVNKDWTLVPTPLVRFKEDIWKDIPIDAKVLGCDPDYNYNGIVNPNPSEKIFNTPLRTGSGHIHIGWTEGEDVQNPMHFEDCRFMAIEFFNAQLFRPRTELEVERLKYYGMNGSFRPKHYGVELREPSPNWIRTEQSIRKTFNMVKSNFEKFASSV